jgi:hypothetical protein
MRVLVIVGALAALAPAANAQVAVGGPDNSRRSLSAGGEVRQEYEWFDNEEWGAEVPDANGYWLQRYMLQVDTRVSGRMRLYGELKCGIEVGRAGGPRGSDQDRLDLQQGFVDLSFGPVTIRIGRRNSRLDCSGLSLSAEDRTSGKLLMAGLSCCNGPAGGLTRSAHGM